MIEITPLMMPGAYKVRGKKFEDERGYFAELFNAKEFHESHPQALNAPYIMNRFCQSNVSHSKKNTVRGLHVQEKHPQGKLVFALSGKVFDVGVDLRQDSPTCGKAFWVELEGPENGVYWPEGTAHGFAAVTDATLLYFCTTVYDQKSDSGIYYADPSLGIPWPVNPECISGKDLALPMLAQWQET